MGLAPNGTILFEETGIGVRPAPGQVLLFTDTTANPQFKFVDDAGNQVQIVDARNTVTLTNKTFTAPNIGAATGTSLAVSGALTTSGSTGGVGYATGAGGTVTQSTSKVTAFTLSEYCGTITFAADALAADTTSAGATWTNTNIAATDIILFSHISGGTIGAYNVTATAAAGSATVYIRNMTAGSLSEAPVFRFIVFKGVTT